MGDIVNNHRNVQNGVLRMLRVVARCKDLPACASGDDAIDHEPAPFYDIIKRHLDLMINKHCKCRMEWAM